MRALLLAAIVAVVAVGCGSGSNDQDAAPVGPQEVIDPPPTADPPPVADRPAAPPIEGATLEGTSISLSDLRGRPVLVNVWSSW